MAIFSTGGQTPEDLGVRDGRLAPCRRSPNCVCSDCGGKRHGIAPLELGGREAGEVWRAVREAVVALPRHRIVTETGDYLHVECRSALWGFADDLELHLRAEEGVIAVRSASRLGYSDFGVNRRRVEFIRCQPGVAV